MLGNETLVSSIITYGRRRNQCPFHRDGEVLNKGRGIGYCDFDRNQTICEGDTRFCDKPDTMRDYMLNKSDQDEALERVQDSVKVAHETSGGTTELRDRESRKSCLRVSVALPLEYWQTEGVRRGGIVENLSEEGLLMHSRQAMPVGRKLNMTVFFPNGYEFDGIRVVGKIIWKDSRFETGWMRYKYGIEFVRISGEDSEKLAHLLSTLSV